MQPVYCKTAPHPLSLSAFNFEHNTRNCIAFAQHGDIYNLETLALFANGAKVEKQAKRWRTIWQNADSLGRWFTPRKRYALFKISIKRSSPVIVQFKFSVWTGIVRFLPGIWRYFWMSSALMDPPTRRSALPNFVKTMSQKK